MADSMAALHGGDAAAFEGLLQMLLATDNDQRSRGESIFQELQKSPDACANHLIRGLRSPERTELRSLSAVLLRRVRFGALLPVRWEAESPFALDYHMFLH